MMIKYDLVAEPSPFYSQTPNYIYSPLGMQSTVDNQTFNLVKYHTPNKYAKIFYQASET